MIVFARGSITKPDGLGPFVDDELRVVSQLKDEGVMKAVYRRAASPGLGQLGSRRYDGRVSASAHKRARIYPARGTAHPAPRRLAASPPRRLAERRATKVE
jgi:hypothetical protein